MPGRFHSLRQEDVPTTVGGAAIPFTEKHTGAENLSPLSMSWNGFFTATARTCFGLLMTSLPSIPAGFLSSSPKWLGVESEFPLSVFLALIGLMPRWRTCWPTLAASGSGLVRKVDRNAFWTPWSVVS